MTTPDPGAGSPRADAVDQARAWLATQVGRSLPGSVTPQAEASTASKSTGGSSSTASPTAALSSTATSTTAPPAATTPTTAGAGRSRSQGIDDPEADPESVARTIALRKLTGQARTRHELDQALQKKNVPDEVAATVLDRLEQVGLIDDATFAQDWIESRQQRRHLSRSALRRELQTKGVDREHVEAALADVDTEAELTAARALVAKKERATRDLDPMVRRRRLAGALARRGFGPGVIAAVLDELRGQRRTSSALDRAEGAP